MPVIINEFEIVPAEQGPPREAAAATQGPAPAPKRPAPPDALRVAMRRRAERRERVRAH